MSILAEITAERIRDSAEQDEARKVTAVIVDELTMRGNFA